MDPNQETLQDSLDIDFGLSGDDSSLSAELDAFIEDGKTPATVAASTEDIKPLKKETPDSVESLQDDLEDHLNKTPEVSEEKEETPEDEDEDDYFTSIAEGYIKMGIWSDNDELGIPQTEEEFVERTKHEHQLGAQNIVNNWISRYGEENREKALTALDAFFNKGVDPEEYINKIGKIESFKTLDIEGDDNTRNQEIVIRTAMSDEGYDPEDIDDEIKRLNDIGELETVAKKKVKVLVKREEANLQKDLKRREQEQYQKQQEELRFQQALAQQMEKAKKAKELNGIPVTEKTANTALEWATKPIGQFPDGTKVTQLEAWWLSLKQPENYETLLSLSLLAQNNLKLDSVAKKAVSNETNSLFRKTTRVHKEQKRTNLTPTEDDFI